MTTDTKTQEQLKVKPVATPMTGEETRKRAYQSKFVWLLIFSYSGYLAYLYLYDIVFVNYLLEALAKGNSITYYEELPRFWDMIWFFEAYDNFLSIMDPFVRSIPKQWDSLIIRSLSSYKYNPDVVALYNSAFLLDISVCFSELRTILGLAPFTGLQFVHYLETLFNIDSLYLGVHIPYPRYEDVEVHYWYRMLSNVLIILLCDYEEFRELYMDVWKFLPKDYFFLGIQIRALPLVSRLSLVVGFFCSFLTILGEPTNVIEGCFEFYASYLEMIIGAFEGPALYFVLFIAILAIISFTIIGLFFLFWKTLMLGYGFFIYYIIGPVVSFFMGGHYLLTGLFEIIVDFHNSDTSYFWAYVGIGVVAFLMIFTYIITIISSIYMFIFTVIEHLDKIFFLKKIAYQNKLIYFKTKKIHPFFFKLKYMVHIDGLRFKYLYAAENPKETYKNIYRIAKEFFFRGNPEFLFTCLEILGILLFWSRVALGELALYKMRELALDLHIFIKGAALWYDKLFNYFNYVELHHLILNNKWWTTTVIDVPMTPREKRRLAKLEMADDKKDAIEFRESFRYYILHYSEYSYFLLNITTYLLPIPFVLTNNFILIFNYFKNNMISDNMIPMSTYRTQNFGPKQHLSIGKYRGRFVNYRGEYQEDANLLLGDEQYIYPAKAFRLTPKWKPIYRKNRSVNFFNDKYRMGKKRKLWYAFPEHDTSEWRIYSYPHFSQLLVNDGNIDGFGIDITDATSNSGSGMQQFFTTYWQVRDEALEKFFIPWLMGIGVICIVSLVPSGRRMLKYWIGGITLPYIFFTEYWCYYESSFDLYHGLVQWMDAEFTVVHPEDFDSEARADGDTEDMFAEWSGDWREFTAIQLPDYEYGYRIAELLKDGEFVYRGDNFTWRMTKYMEGNLYRGRLVEWDRIMRVKSGNRRRGGPQIIYTTRCYLRMKYYTTQYAYNGYMKPERRIPGLVSKDMDLVHYRVSKNNLMITYVLRAVNPEIKISKLHPDHGTLNKEPLATMNNVMEIQRLAKRDPRLIRREITTPDYNPGRRLK